MAGGKKKTLANKLAKMSDEERARYLQHKADMEEEAKRRKEQLIATFMKKKIKKEDAFSRLNLAKINQNWHQILRKEKCQEMKENVGHLREWIDRLLTFKNRTISKLMEELEDAEEQYSNNFQYHSTHIDNIIEKQHEYITKLQRQYDEDLCDLLETACTENELLSKNAQFEQEHLKTVLYRQQSEGRNNLREQYECYMVKFYENEHNAKLSRLRVSREAMSGALWRQIATVVRLYVQQTDSRRMHLAELRELDAESAVDIAENEERMKREEALISRLRKDHENRQPDRELKINQLKLQVEDLSKSFMRLKKCLQKDLQADDRKLQFVTDCATSSVRYLEKLARKGELIKSLANTCRKYETEREKVAKWLPVTHQVTKYAGDDDDDFKESVKVISEELKDIGNMQDEFRSIRDCALPMLRVPDSRPSRRMSWGRPKTAISGLAVKSAPSLSTATPRSRRLTTLKSVTVQAKSATGNLSRFSPFSSSRSQSSTAGEESSKHIVERCVESLKGMENFWFVFNKAEIDYMEMKEEKRILERENKQLRGTIRAALEAAALSQTVPNSGASTRLPSRRRTAHSAPLGRVVFA